MKWSSVGTVLALLAITAIASAHYGNNDTNVIHACIGNASKIVRIVGVGGSCISSPASLAETPAHWAIQGPSGAPGINGINGTNGVNGTNGTNGIDGINGTNGTNGTNGIDGVSATRADGPCFDDSNRYVDCGNGTVTDTVTGLIWLQDATCLGFANWADANRAAAGLKNGDCGGNLTDKSSPGDWRLPTRDEWIATFAQAVNLGCEWPVVWTDDAGRHCYVGVGSFTGLHPATFFSSSSVEAFPIVAWVASIGTGEVGLGLGISKTDFSRAWAVRGSPR
jgi:hypothetical protein